MGRELARRASGWLDVNTISSRLYNSQDEEVVEIALDAIQRALEDERKWLELITGRAGILLAACGVSLSLLFNAGRALVVSSADTWVYVASLILVVASGGWVIAALFVGTTHVVSDRTIFSEQVFPDTPPPSDGEYSDHLAHAYRTILATQYAELRAKVEAVRRSRAKRLRVAQGLFCAFLVALFVLGLSAL
jgi:hypothetical protein